MSTAPKLTKAQWTALEALSNVDRVSYATWGGDLITRLPKGIASRSTLYALNRAGLAKCLRDMGSTDWSITSAGREALAAREADPS